MGDSIHQFLQNLEILSKDSHFKSVTADENRDDYIRDSFIRGLSATHIRQRLLENTTLTLQKAYDSAGR